MLWDEIFRLMDRWGKFVGALSAFLGLISIFVGKDIAAYILIFIACFLSELWLLGILRQKKMVEKALREGKHPPSPIYTESQRRIVAGSIALISICSLGLVVWLALTFIHRVSMDVFSARYPFANTGISVKASDQVEITVTGQNPIWNCGRRDSISPEGYAGERYSDTVYPQANPCALVGSISSALPELYFLVGSHATFTAENFGTLYLGCNDSMERFDDNPTGSSLNVKIVIVRWSNILPITLAFLVLVFSIIALIPKFHQ